MTFRRVTPDDGPPRVDVEALARLAAEAVVEHIVARVGEGLDVDDRAFLPYSAGYADERRRLGRDADSVTLTMTGGLLNNVKVLEIKSTPDIAEAIVGVGTGTSRRLRAPPKTRNRSKRRTTRTAARGPEHVVVAQAHNEGLGNLPKREWFGVSPSGDESIERQVQDGAPDLD